MSQKDYQRLRKILRDRARSETKAWFEEYTRSHEKFLGLKTPEVERALREFLAANPAVDHAALADALLECDFTEERLAGMILHQKWLLPARRLTLSEYVDLTERLVTGGKLGWWNSTDWYCVRVLAPLLQQEGKALVKHFKRWSRSEALWQRRVSVVPFVKFASKPDVLYPDCLDDIRKICGRLVRSNERFDQTAVGWVMREVGKGDEAVLHEFVREHLEFFSAEGLRYATEKLTKEQRAQYRSMRKHG